MTGSRREHETVGQRFRAMGSLYLCTRWEKRAGFWMRLLSGDGWPGGHLDRCISERAIGRTYHRIYDDQPSAEHEQPCDCSICAAKISPTSIEV